MLKPQVDTLDEVPEALRSEYVEKDGKFHLQIEDAEAVYGAGAKKKADELLKEKKTLAEKLKRFAAFDDPELDVEGLTAEQVKQALAMLREHDEKGGKDNGKDPDLVDKLLKKRDDEWKPKVEAEKARADKAEAELRRYKLDLVVKDAALKGGVRPERVDYAMRINKDRFDLDEKGNPVVLDKDGDPISISLETFWKDDWKTGNEDFYVGHNAGGSGASGGNGRRSGGPDLSKLPPAERLKQARRQQSST
jgi:hypothetical protein